MTSTPKNLKVRRSFIQRYAAAPHITWAILFIIAPLIFVAYYAFTKNVDGTIVFSLDNIKEFFTPNYLKIFARSVTLALISTVICLFLGYPIAYFISRTKPKTQRLLILLIMLPMWMNFLIRTYAIMELIKDTGIINKYDHIIILAKNEQGYKNMCQLSTQSFIDGFYVKPRIDDELLERYSEGLICLSACISGRIPKLLLCLYFGQNS